ncbi:ATP-binding cassette, subfamily B [Methylomagnum ishizawai]|uniref:ATP-binding cassette, subfamily B n=1 Tax=Methylomagnum ishizawai TaxID=1760988 RepID=A0A1Y6D458_9GAMM|nr:ABC transporter ATP-binding protein [Methylomagnum ishizawai]SMF97728.1 ATP-binding cassette, subfamily B [Methylomagnum ishizawai]
MKRGPGPDLIDRHAVRLFAHYYRSRRVRLLFYALAAALQSLLVLPILYLIRLVFDQAIPEGKADWLPLLGGAIVLIRLLHSGMALWLRGIVLDMVKGAVQALRQDLLDRLYVLSREHFNHADLDRMHTRIVLDSERFDTLSNRLLSSLLPAVFASAALLGVVLILNWRLVAMTALLLPVLAWTSRRAGARVKADVHDCQQAMEQFSKGARFTLRQMDLIRLQACEAREKIVQRQYIQALSASSRRMAMSFALHGQIQRNLTGWAGIIILVAGGTAVAQGGMTLGDLMSFYVAAGLLNGQVDALAGGIPELIAGQEALTKLHGLLSEGEEQPYPGRRRIAFDGGVSLRGASFAYDGHSVLRSVDLEIPPGACVAIVGPNGAGKTTLLGLVVGFCRPQAGSVYASGVAYDELDMPALRQGMGVVMQQQSFFAGTVLDNLRYGHPEADLEAVRAAARLALADDFVAALPQGYDTEMGEGGALLSGGERQRLAIARALLGGPKLLILDEPTNHLDAEAIARLMDNLLRVPNRPAILIISHDPGVVAFADRVYRLEQGRLRRVSPLHDEITLSPHG